MVIFTQVSGNKKTGPIPVSMTSKVTCPDTCPLKAGGCYASGGPINLHWQRLTKGATGITWKEFVTKVKALPRGQLWRHNQAGDLPGQNNRIDVDALRLLVEANKDKRGFTYTHKPVIDGQANAKVIAENRAAIAHSNAKGFTVNLSANNLEHADKLKALNVGPVVTLLPSTQTANCVTEGGNKVIVCPATQRENVTCATCKLCSVSKRSVIIGFPAHGVSIKKADAIVEKFS